MGKLTPIITEEDYNQALERLKDIFDAKPNTKDGEELEILGGLISEYEDEHFPIETTNQSNS
ncbi:hypothetical protein D3C87_961670 [compost metagenome]|nr:hypothetical protein [Chryseobacterium sp.]MBP7499940.1 hypothetical protein [Chryseobacterium sp.]